jgi:hypothetical protein
LTILQFVSLACTFIAGNLIGFQTNHRKFHHFLPFQLQSIHDQIKPAASLSLLKASEPPNPFQAAPHHSNHSTKLHSPCTHPLHGQTIPKIPTPKQSHHGRATIKPHHPSISKPASTTSQANQFQIQIPIPMPLPFHQTKPTHHHNHFSNQTRASTLSGFHREFQPQSSAISLHHISSQFHLQFNPSSSRIAQAPPLSPSPASASHHHLG